MGFLTREEEAAVHDRVRATGRLAWMDLFSAFMAPLVSALQHDLRCDRETAHDAAADALVEYLDAPTRYLAERGRLSTFLACLAKYRAIERMRARAAEIRREEEFARRVELTAPTAQEKVERDLDARTLWSQFVAKGVDGEPDRGVLAVMFGGSQSTGGVPLDGLAEPERRQRAKRRRDQLLKTLKRLGARMRDD